MFILLFVIILLSLPVLGLLLFTRIKANRIKRCFPPVGDFKTVDGLKVHYVDIPANDAHAPTIVFLHGASGNLRDPLHAFGGRLNGKVRQIFIDRPGHGWSERGKGDIASPIEQGKHVLGLLDALGIQQAIFVGHSWGGALAVTLGVEFPERVSGLLLNAPVSHSWPGGVNWYYDVAAIPVLGKLFAYTVTLPVGAALVPCATDKVFWPNQVPDYYTDQVGADMVLVPERFHANSLDIASLHDHIVRISHRYREIKTPTVLITGDKDQIVFPWIHSDGLERDIEGLRRIDLKDTGHMPHHVVPDLFANTILELAAEVGYHGDGMLRAAE